ncbi:MAG: hypothetical protein AAB402_01075 [Patescibacteria group bacterium]
MDRDFLRHHKTAVLAFTIGVVLAVLYLTLPALHDFLSQVNQLGYPGMLLAGVMYGSALTSSLATILFVDTPPHLNPIMIGLIGGFGAALYDLSVFLLTRREAEHGWLARVIARLRERRHVPNWLTALMGVVILASPLPDELAAGLFGINRSRSLPFFLLSFASNTLGIVLLSVVV